jgi:hypothetical protein
MCYNEARESLNLTTSTPTNRGFQNLDPAFSGDWRGVSEVQPAFRAKEI